MGKGTRSVRGSTRHVNDEAGSVIEPIYQTSLFDFREPEDRPSLHGVVPLKYSREDNPTVYAVESKMAELEHGVDALGTSSGMAAITTLMMSLLSKDSTVLMPLDVYGSTLVLMERLNRFGVRTVITDPGTNNVINSLRNSINVVFIESVSNPLLRVYDVPEIVKASHEAGATVVVDNTLATPIGLTPINHGVDFVIHSATKYLSGHNDVVAGFIVGNDDRIKGVWEWRRFLGTIMEPFTAFLLNRGLKTLHIRMRTHEENAKAVAEFLMNHPKVERVYYPCLNNHETHETAKKLLSNCGGIVSFEVRGGLKEAMAVYKHAKMIIPSVSFGGTESIITHPASTTHAHWSPEDRARAGIKDNLLRLSVGLEDPEDIINDLSQALNYA
ncbi:trans-sulfuration enzyme family protein [Vulcanisaeta souniana]|uniref:Cystathionine gamma-synthase n=1 Tax=Vulcanisaeta souniana JCM 11219 TaxID=1293586 RepID=A0A830E4E4_9CREN|nr:aminotransferase class V-fold PLP-dependent enzyme [Vulcanisaeta souniana]BDR91906.1 cystathionine gamma-synthase [Vulcanisaeta souniana JCM 11219]GGI69467.1 cystathionine gamma-synthase [Vulcanisaeta souniana JCM 11219]